MHGKKGFPWSKLYLVTSIISTGFLPAIFGFLRRPKHAFDAGERRWLRHFEVNRYPCSA
jgi:hypothetical protein